MVKTSVDIKFQNETFCQKQIWVPGNIVIPTLCEDYAFWTVVALSWMIKIQFVHVTNNN